MVSDDQQGRYVDSLAAAERKWRNRGRKNYWGGSELAATPFLEWKLHRGDQSGGGSRGHRRGDGGGAVAAVSARKLAAALWKLTATSGGGGGGSVRWQCGLFDRLSFEFSSLPVPKFEMEGVTKWDYCNLKSYDDFCYSRTRVKSTSDSSDRQIEFLKAQKHVNEHEAEPGWSKTKIKYLMMKFNEERESRTEHQRMCSVVENLMSGVKRERKNCQKKYIVNSKLLRDIASAKLSAMKFMENLEKEKKSRKSLENAFGRLAKEMERNKAEIGALRNQRKRIQEHVEEERKMLQIAEVWREEQAQMKLTDAKLILEDKLVEINSLIADLVAFLVKSNLTADVNVTDEFFSSRTLVGDKGSRKSETSEISSLSLEKSNKKEKIDCKKQKSLKPRNKDKCKRIVIDRSMPSIVTMTSPQGVLGEREYNVRRNPHVVRAMKGHIEWPRRIRKEGLAGNILEAKLESQKMLMRNVLKQRS